MRWKTVPAFSIPLILAAISTVPAQAFGVYNFSPEIETLHISSLECNSPHRKLLPFLRGTWLATNPAIDLPRRPTFALAVSGSFQDRCGSIVVLGRDHPLKRSTRARSHGIVSLFLVSWYDERVSADHCFLKI